MGTVVCLTATASITAFAGEWKQDKTYDTLWWYQRDDGSYPVSCWETIDGKSYHFSFDGYLDQDCVTEDGYTVDENGVWLENIPQKSPEEMKQDTINRLIDLYENGGFTDDAEFEIWVSLLFTDEVEAQQIINDIRSNHTFVAAAEF